MKLFILMSNDWSMPDECDEKCIKLTLHYCYFYLIA